LSGFAVPIERILIVGLGSIGKRHLRLARQILPTADIRILRHHPGSEAPESANGVFFRMAEAIDFAPQIAVIANPAPFHVATAQALASAGAHLLLEKPLSDSLTGVTQLLEICRQQRVRLLTGYNLRFVTSLQRFRHLLSERIVGRVLSVRCEVGQFLPDWRADSDYRQSVSAQRKLGGGALLELSHELDYLRWIFGEVEWVHATLSRQSTLELDVEDTAHLSLGFMPTSDTPPLIASVNLDFIRHDTTRLCTAIGESGSLRWNGVTGCVELYQAGAKQWEELFRQPQQRDDSYLAQWNHLIDCVQQHAAPLISGEDGLRVLEIIEAARSSASTGRTLSIASIRQADRSHT
jgi:predicted dehydrogenase